MWAEFSVCASMVTQAVGSTQILAPVGTGGGCRASDSPCLSQGVTVGPWEQIAGHPELQHGQLLQGPGLFHPRSRSLVSKGTGTQISGPRGLKDTGGKDTESA